LRKQLLSFEDALRIVMKAVPSPRREEVPLSQAVGRVLARDVRADRDLPPFDRAALDGYAVHVSGPFGTEQDLPVIGEVAAGERPPRNLAPGRCVRIWTGAAVPLGAQGIIPVEVAEERGNRVLLDGPLVSVGKRRAGIADRGEDARRGEILLQRGRRLTAGDLVVLGGVGCFSVSVFSEPEVAVAVTGHELVSPDEAPNPYQIRSTNDLIVSAIGRQVGVGRIRSLGILEDQTGVLRRAVYRGLRSEVMIITGGVSMGRLDLVPEILADLGVRIRIHGVAIRPGKPFLFGTCVKDGRRTAVFGLPGNPVSTMVTMMELVAPFLRAWRGEPQPMPRSATARMMGPISRGSGLLHFVPATLSIDARAILWANPLRMNGSGDFVSAARATAFLRVPGDGKKRQKGSVLRADLVPGASPLGEADDT
jgi:molybdenum cofactor synthesis domain-containing protein